MTSIIGIFGGGAFGAETLRILRQIQVSKNISEEIVFVDRVKTNELIYGVSVISEKEFDQFNVHVKKFVIAISDVSKRKLLHKNLIQRGYLPINIVSPKTEIFSETINQNGLVLCSFSTISNNVHIGTSVHINFNTYIGHDCRIGEFVTVGPGVTCAGNVTIGDNVFIGAGATIRNGTPDLPLSIGSNSRIGMGAVVVDNVPEGVTVFGNPARKR